MEDLKELYLAILARLKILTKNKNELPNEPLVELRLDIEQVIALICRENQVPYDGFLAELNPDEVIENLWTSDDEVDDE